MIREIKLCTTPPESINADIIRSRRKTLALQIAEDGSLIVRSPMRCPEKEIALFIAKNRAWVEKHTEKAKQRAMELSGLEPFSSEDIRNMAEKAAEILPGRVSFYAEKLGVTYGRITVRCQKTKWGSCTAKGNLNFNCLLMAAPPEVLDSVVVHELCHRLHMNHSKEFYAAVYSAFPDYDRWNSWLRENGGRLIKGMLAGGSSNG